MRTSRSSYRTDQGQMIAIPPGLKVVRAYLDKDVEAHMKRAGFIFPAYRLRTLTEEMRGCGRFMEEHEEGSALLNATQVEPGLPNTALVRFLLNAGPLLTMLIVARCLDLRPWDWLPWLLMVAAGALSWVVFSAITPPKPEADE